jgi:hypothetical protein
MLSAVFPSLQIISAKLTYVGQVHGTSVATATPLAGVPNAGQTTETAKLTGVVRWVGVSR